MDHQAYPHWETTRSKTALRKRRTPEETVLYRMVYYNLEALKWCWEDRFQQEYGVLRSEVRKAFDDFLNCGILYHGCAIAKCESCSHSELIAFSCKKRGICPSCDAKRAVIFAEHLYQFVLPKYPTSHIVFTIPKKRLRYFSSTTESSQNIYILLPGIPGKN